MSDYLWKKQGGEGPDEAVMRFLSGEDVVLDRELMPYDLRTSIAHARGLEAIGVLDGAQSRALVEALEGYLEEWQRGERRLGEEFEDSHSAIEAWLTRDLGDLGERIHTGRSRNDQVAVALRLYMKNALADLARRCLAIAGECLERARREAEVPMPGYTHLQRAMPSSAGLWLAGHGEAFLEDADLAVRIRGWLDASPLGTASGFGVNLPLARDLVADDLGFSRLVVNPQCAQNSRGKVEVQALGAVAAATHDLRRLAWDLSLFVTSEFGFVELPERWCTGSSIMPNKRNPDVVELLRAVHARVVGGQAELQAALDLPSGYHRDLQATKPPLLRSFSAALQALALVPGLIREFVWNERRMLDAIDAPMFATDRATALAARGVPFREAYRRVAADLAAEAEVRPGDSLRARTSGGACGDLLLDRLDARREELLAAI